MSEDFVPGLERRFDPPGAFRHLSAAEQDRFRDALLGAISGAQRSAPGPQGRRRPEGGSG